MNNGNQNQGFFEINGMVQHKIALGVKSEICKKYILLGIF